MTSCLRRTFIWDSKKARCALAVSTERSFAYSMTENAPIWAMVVMSSLSVKLWIWKVMRVLCLDGPDGFRHSS